MLMRIYFFIDEIDGTTSGTEKQLVLLIRQLADRGHYVRLFVLRATDFSDNVSDFPCPIECLGIDSLISATTAIRLLRLRRRLRNERPDVIHSYFNDCALIVPLACSRRHSRVFTSRRDMGYWYTVPQLLLLYVVNRFCTAIVCNSEAVARNVRRRERVSAEKSVVIYNGVERVGAGDPVDTLPEIESNENITNICLVANIRPIKRIEDAVDAIRRTRDAGYDARLYIAGAVLDDDYWLQIERDINESDLSDRVHWVGELRNPRQLMQRCDIGILTSGSEGFSNTLLEYFAEGLPAICTEAGGSAEIVKPGVNGNLYSVGAVSALAQYIKTLIDDPAHYEQMAASARQTAKRFSVADLVRNHLALYGC